MHRNLGPILALLGTALLSPVILLAPGQADDGREPPVVDLSLGTATQGGGFQLYGTELAAVITGVDPRLAVTPLATRGSRHNLELLEAGDIDLALVEGNAARVALEGIGREPADLHVLAVMYPNPGMFVVRADSPYRRIDDLRGQPVAFGTRASGLRILAHDMLQGLGLSPEHDFQQMILDKAGDGPRLVLEGEVAALWGAGIGWPGFVAVADAPRGARFIAPSSEQIEMILSHQPHLRRMSVPANTYAGQTSEIASLGLWSLILVREDMPAETAYRLVQAIGRGEEQLAARLAQGRYTTLQNTASEVPPEQLHPGVRRYLQDKGLLP